MNLSPISAQSMGEDLKRQEMRLIMKKPVTVKDEEPFVKKPAEDEKSKSQSTQATSELLNLNNNEAKSQGIQKDNGKKYVNACCCLIF